VAIKACNPTAGAIDPDGGGGTYHYVAFNN
jgi:hypothetical protein